MICYKIKEGGNFCIPENASRWVQRVVLINRADVSKFNRTRYGIDFITREKSIGAGDQIGGKAFEYPNVFSQILGNAESVDARNYSQWRHNVQLSLVGFEHFKTFDEINRSEYFASLLDSNDKIWIFGFDYGLKPDPYFVANTEFTTLTLRSKALEDSPPLRYLGDSKYFWNNFTSIPVPPVRGDFNDDFNDDFDNR